MLESYPYEKEDFTARRSRSSRAAPVPAFSPGVKHFYGSSRGNRPAHLYGSGCSLDLSLIETLLTLYPLGIHAVPAQHDITGFQRVTMMRFYPDENGDYDPAQVWCYEGCVLPGGRIIVGRWWDNSERAVSHQTLSGPFMFWNVDMSGVQSGIDCDEALEFFNNIQDYELMGGAKANI